MRASAVSLIRRMRWHEQHHLFLFLCRVLATSPVEIMVH